jgi:hypothetical protein
VLEFALVSPGNVGMLRIVEKHNIGRTIGLGAIGFVALMTLGSVAHAQGPRRPRTATIQVSVLVVAAPRFSVLAPQTLAHLVQPPVAGVPQGAVTRDSRGWSIAPTLGSEMSVVVERVAAVSSGASVPEMLMCRPTDAAPDCHAQSLRTPVTVRGTADPSLFLMNGTAVGSTSFRATIAYITS